MSTPAAAGAVPRVRTPARFQPLLLAAGIAAVLPTIADGGVQPWLVASLVVLAGVSIALWWAFAQRPLSSDRRRRLGVWLATVSVAALILVLFGPGDASPETFLLMVSALVCALASIHSVVMRWALQLASVAAIATALLLAERSMLDVIVSAGLVLVVAVLANLLAGELMSARLSEIAVSDEAERRTELLEAVRDLPGTSPDDAAAATVRTLRALAFDTACVLVLRDGQLREVGGDGEVPVVLPRGASLEWQVIDEDRTIVGTAGSATVTPDHTALGDARSVVATPIRVGGHPAGAVVGGRQERRQPSPAEVEVAEVLAAHLGVVLDTEAQVLRQRELLERMAELDRMRSGFAREVSSELRDPLTIVRTVGAALTRHGDGIDASRRRALLEQMCEHADDLRRTIDALLDFSRFQADREVAEVAPVPLADLLAPVLRAIGATSEPDLGDLRDVGTVVEADAVLVRHALEILLVAGLVDVGEEPRATVRVVDGRDGELRLEVVRDDGAVPSTLVRSLVSQLLVSGGAALDEGAEPVVLLRRLGGSLEVAP